MSGFRSDKPRYEIEDSHPIYHKIGPKKIVKPFKPFDEILLKGELRGDKDICKIHEIMDDYNLKPNEDDSGIDTLNVKLRERFPWGEGMNHDWKSLNWKCRNCNNQVYSQTHPGWNAGEKGTYNWCYCGNPDTFFDKEGMIDGIKTRKAFGTSFLDIGVWN